MKLIEKLGWEAAKAALKKEHKLTDLPEICAGLYEEGFRKAREMTQKHVNDIAAHRIEKGANATDAIMIASSIWCIGESQIASGIEFVTDSSCPENEIHLRLNGKTIAKITNLLNASSEP